ncbi:MAG: hypothetical protein ACR2GG_00720 [Gemmatimonadaceae bacterium]
MRIINTFSREDFIDAFRRVLPIDEAEELADRMSVPIDEVDENGLPWFPPDYVGDPRVYSAYTLDLLSLVSDELAEKIWAAMKLSPAEGRERRARFQEQLDSSNRGETPSL